MTWLEETNAALEPLGMSVDRYNPGGVTTRYKFFTELGRDYFSGGGIFTAMGKGDADTFAAGLVQGAEVVKK